MIIVCIVGFLSFPGQAVDIKYALGAKFIYFLPGVSGQLWLNNNVGIEASLWPYAPLWTIVEGNILFQRELWGLKSVIGLGFMNITGGVEEARGSESAINISLGLKFGDEKSSFVPAIRGWISNGRILNSFTFVWGAHRFI